MSTLRRRLEALAKRTPAVGATVPRDGWSCIWRRLLGERDESGDELLRRHRLDELLRAILRGPGRHDEP